MLRFSMPVIGGASVGLALVYATLSLVRHLRKVSIKGKVVLITGASSGIGEACARAFYRAGCRVILCARREQELERVKRELLQMKIATDSHEPHVLRMDVTDFGRVPAKITAAAAVHGRIDILISNCGIGSQGSVLDTELDVYKQLMNTNFFGQVAVIRATLPHMIENGGGHIVTMNSLQGLFGLPYRSAYGASKHAMTGFCDGLRVEVQPHNIHVCNICPSYIKTGFSYSALNHDGQKLGVMDSNLKRGMPVEKVAADVINAVIDRKQEVLLGSYTHCAAVYLRALWISMFTRVMLARSADERHIKKTS